MLSMIKERVPFLKKQTIDDYTQTVLMPSFNMIELNYHANNIGISVTEYNDIIKQTKNVHNNDTNYKITKLINYIKQVIFDEEFINKMISKLIFVVEYGSFNIKIKSFVGEVNIDNNKYKFALDIDNTSMFYACEYKSINLKGRFSLEADGIKIKYTKINKEIKTLSSKLLYNVDNDTNLKIYNKNGIQKFGYIKKQKYHYYEDIKTKEKIINTINPNDNYTKQEYVWRCSHNTILKNIKLKYQYPKEISNLENKDEYLIGKNISPNSNKLPSKGQFYKIDRNAFLDYFQNKCDINNLWDDIIDYKLIK